ncbi:MAG: TetR/AcrR family transcriptional regulator [Acidimicrobiales bacterium]
MSTGAMTAIANTDEVLVDAALECFGRWGIAKTTAEDIAREAGVSRATVYRSFPGGKAAILQAVGAREIGRLTDEVIAATRDSADLESVLVDGIVSTCRSLRSHRALNFLLAHEPEAVLPFLAFDRLGPALAVAGAVCGPVVARFVAQETAEELVEWATRMILSLTFAPGLVDPTDRGSVQRMVHDLLLPGFAAEARPTDSSPTIQSSTHPVPAKEHP